MLVEEQDDAEDSFVPDGFEVAWSLSHVAEEVNRLCALLAGQGIAASESRAVFPWHRWKEMSESLSFPNDVRNVRLLVDAERVEEAQRIIEDTVPELVFDGEDPPELDEGELDGAGRRYEGRIGEIGDMGGPPLAGG